MNQNHTIGSLETWEPEDKSFSKHTTQQGQGDVTPNEGSVCVVRLTPLGKQQTYVQCWQQKSVKQLKSSKFLAYQYVNSHAFC